MSRKERKSPFWRSKSTTQTGRPGAARTAASASWSATVVVPTPPLEPATAISWPPSAAPADSSPATRSRIVRDHWAAARTLASSCSSESGSVTTSRRPACMAARSTSGESSAAISTSPISGKLAEMSRATSITGTAAERVVQHDDVDLEPAQRARRLLGVRDAVDDLEALALLHQRDRALGELGVGDRQQQAVLGHRSSGRMYVRSSFFSGVVSFGRSSARRTSWAKLSASVTRSCCFGVSAKVTGTTCSGSASASWTPRPPSSLG